MKQLLLLIPQKFEIVGGTKVTEISKQHLEWEMRKTYFENAALVYIDSLFESRQEYDPIDGLRLKDEYQRVDFAELYGMVFDILIENAEALEKRSPLACLLDEGVEMMRFHNRYGLHVEGASCLKGENVLYARQSVIRSLDAVRLLHQRGMQLLTGNALKSLENLVARDRQVLSEEEFLKHTERWNEDDLRFIAANHALPVAEILSCGKPDELKWAGGVFAAAPSMILDNLPPCSRLALCRSASTGMDNDIDLVRANIPDFSEDFRNAKASGIARIRALTKNAAVNEPVLCDLAELIAQNAAGSAPTSGAGEAEELDPVGELLSIKDVVMSFIENIDENPMLLGTGYIEEYALQDVPVDQRIDLQAFRRALKGQWDVLRKIIVAGASQVPTESYATNSPTAVDAILKDHGTSVWICRPDLIEQSVNRRPRKKTLE